MRASVSFCLFPSAPLRCLDKRAALCGGAALLVLGAALMSPGASAQTDIAAGLDTSGNFKSEMAACAKRATPQARKICIGEARTAETARRMGKLENHGGQFQANALKRCDVFKADDDRAACQARVQRGDLEGSVLDGGVLRESEVTVVIPGDTTNMETMPMPSMPMPTTPEPMPMPAPSVPQ